MTSPPGARSDATFSLTIVADFGTPRGSVPELIRLEAGEFPALFQRLRPWREIRTTDLLTGASRQVSWAATIVSMRDFDPEALLARFPPAAPLLAWRARLLEVARTGSGLPGLADSAEDLWPDVPSPARRAGATGSQGAPRPSGARGISAADALLDLVDLPGAPASEPPARLAGVRERLRLVLAMPGTAADVRLRLARETVDEALARQLQAILHDPALRDCEAVWRSLWAIAEAADLRRGDLQIHLMSAPREEMPETLERLLLWSDEGRAGAPRGGAILVDSPIASDPLSAEILAACGRLARALEARAVLPLDPDLFGADADRATGRPRPIPDFFSSAPMAGIVEALARDEAHGLTLTCNRFLYRPLYDPEETPGPFGGFRETAATAGGPYASAVWIAGRGLASAVRRDGAEAATALEAVQVGGLPLRTIHDVAGAGAAGSEHSLATEFLLGVAQARALLDAGLSPLTSEIDQDRATLRRLRAYEAPSPDSRPAGAETVEPGAPPATEATEGQRTGITTHFTVETPPPKKDEETTA